MFDVTWDYGQSETVGQRRSRKKGKGHDVPDNTGSRCSAPSRKEQPRSTTSSVSSFSGFFSGWKNRKERPASFHSSQERDVTPPLSRSSTMEPAELPGLVVAQTSMKPSEMGVSTSIVHGKGTLSVVDLSSPVSVSVNGQYFRTHPQ